MDEHGDEDRDHEHRADEDRADEHGGPVRTLVFGAVAEGYDEVRPGYPPQLVDAVLSFAGAAGTGATGVAGTGMVGAVEIGAGTGKGTGGFLARGVPLTCLEPDPAMAAVLRARHPEVTVVGSRFEDWAPPARGVALLLAPQSWHWLDPGSRCARAHAALCPGGTLAIFGHKYRFADARAQQAYEGVCADVAPELLEPPGKPTFGQAVAGELASSGLFTDVGTERFRTDVDYPTERYLRLLRTFSPILMLAPARRAELLRRVGTVVDAHGGHMSIALDTTLILARSG